MTSPDVDAELLRLLLGDSPVTEVLLGEDWRSFRLRAQLQRVVPLLYRMVDLVPTDLNDAQRQELLQLQGDAMAWAVRVEHHLLDATSALDCAGIPFAVLKGAATAHLDYPDPTWRQFGDADLLVDPDLFDEACALVTCEGWVQAYPLPRRHKEFTHAITFTRRGVELDIHQHLAHRAIGRLVSSSSVLDDRVPFEIAGARLYALSTRDRLIHAAIHAVTARGSAKRLSSVADVLLLAHRQQPRAADALARAGRWGIRHLVERAVAQAYGAAMTPIVEPWRMAIDQAPELGPSLVERVYLSERRHPIVEELVYLRRLGWAERIRYLDGHMRPGETHLTMNSPNGERSNLKYLRSKLRRTGTAAPLPLAMRPGSGEKVSDDTPELGGSTD